MHPIIHLSRFVSTGVAAIGFLAVLLTVAPSSAPGLTAVIEAGVQLTLKVGGNFIDINPAGVFIQGTMVMINSGGAPGAGPGASPTAPQDAKEAAPKEPEEADKAVTGNPSTPAHH